MDVTACGSGTETALGPETLGPGGDGGLVDNLEPSGGDLERRTGRHVSRADVSWGGTGAPFGACVFDAASLGADPIPIRVNFEDSWEQKSSDGF